MRLNNTIYIIAFFCLIISCKNSTERSDVSGKYHSQKKWNNNDTYIDLRPDSEFTFKVVKEYCPGKKYFCSAGKWKTYNDSLVTLECDSVKRNFKTYFPDVLDTQNVIAINMSATFIIRHQKLYNINTDGRASAEQYYDKIK